MRISQLYFVLVVLFLLSCEGKDKPAKVPVVNDRIATVDIVNKYHNYCKKEKLKALTTLYSDGCALKTDTMSLRGQIYAEQFEFGNLTKSILTYYEAKPASNGKSVTTFKLMLRNQYCNCKVIETFEMIKDKTGKIAIVNRQLKFI